MSKISAIPLSKVSVKDQFWTKLQNLVIDVMLPYQADVFEDKTESATKSHAIRNFKIAAREMEGEFYGMVFQDSDVAKWLESVGYALTVKPNPKLEEKADEYIDLIGRAQEEDGYLNTYFSIKEPEKKWQNLQECHELYCNGHMIEAAVAYFEATGKDSLLKIMQKTAKLICDRFGADKIRGIPGHQEIELALLRLYQITGEKSYLDTARYFLEERGTKPNFFEEELKKREWQHKWESNFTMDPLNTHYAQNHKPAKEQDIAVGHSVRAVYMYAAMALLSSVTGDEEWLNACKQLWRNIVSKQMYITGGIGQTVRGESFTIDYDLPNDTVYAETCASIAMVFFARYMNEIEPIGEYGDIIEKMLYNGALSGMQQDGKRFFYVNPLEVVPGISGELFGHEHVKTTRPEWYTCACCPPNLARLITSLGQYIWSQNDRAVFCHQFISSRVESKAAGGVTVVCISDFPWKNEAGFVFHPKARQDTFTFAFRIPAWSSQTSFLVNGFPVAYEIENGYCYIKRKWRDGDTLVITFDMKPKRVYTNAKVRDNAGQVALMRGPVVYAFEEVDNGADLSALRLPRDSAIYETEQLLEGVGRVVMLEIEGKRMESSKNLYETTPPKAINTRLVAVPYYAWGNRKPGGMRVWMVE